MKKFLFYGILPSVIIYIIVGMIDISAGVCTDRVLFMLIFNSVLILPVCCVASALKSNADVKKCFIAGLIIPVILPCAQLCIYLSVLGFEILLSEIIFFELVFVILSYIIIIPGMVLALYKKRECFKNTAKTVLSCVLSVVLFIEAVFGVLLIASADEWQVPYEKYEIFGDFDAESEGYSLLREDDAALIYVKTLRGGRDVYCKVYDNKKGDSVTVEKWGHGTD